MKNRVGEPDVHKALWTLWRRPWIGLRRLFSPLSSVFLFWRTERLNSAFFQFSCTYGSGCDLESANQLCTSWKMAERWRPYCFFFLLLQAWLGESVLATALGCGAQAGWQTLVPGAHLGGTAWLQRWFPEQHTVCSWIQHFYREPQNPPATTASCLWQG